MTGRRARASAIAVMALCSLAAFPPSTFACIDCEGALCSVTGVQGKTRCKTTSTYPYCKAWVDCGESVPPRPRPPIDVVVRGHVYLMQTGTEPLAGLPSVIPAGTSAEMKDSIASQSLLDQDQVRLIDGIFHAGDGFPGDREDALGIDDTGFVFVAEVSADNHLRLRVCTYDLQSARFNVVGDLTLIEGQAYAFPVELAKQSAVVALDFTVFPEEQFVESLADVQSEFWDDVKTHIEFPAFSLHATVSTEDCRFAD